jgi:hypothetical protein
MDFITTGRRNTPHPGDNSGTMSPPVHYHGVFIFNSIIIQEGQSRFVYFQPNKRRGAPWGEDATLKQC